ncbi:MAG TPA: hypothetical protein IAC38_05065 [Candidatus Caccovivens faecavium]|nr:hypothetical protein [Candidatus Caccovivens faecavium]
MENRQYVENIARLINRQQRTRFKMTDNNGALKLTTMNKGFLYPIFCEEVLPGDTWKVNIKALIRATTLIKPIFNNMWAQIQCFFVPNRLTYEHWEEVMGENKEGPWITNKTTYEVPPLNAPVGGWGEKTLADYLGIPTKKSGIKINSLYTKGYCQIWNDWYRDENRQNLTHITTGQNVLNGSNAKNDYINGPELGGAILPVCKAHDLFTSSSIEPQKGPEVLLPLGTNAPVITSPKNNNYKTGEALKWLNTITGQVIEEEEGAILGIGNKHEHTQNTVTYHGTTNLTDDTETHTTIGPANLNADLSKATSATINDLRLAIALQQMYELDALSGTRYTEIIYSHFGVRSSDARLQRSEYLGGKKIPINITQVIQNSETATTPQGNLAGMSQTWDGDDYFTKSFEEHGILYVMCCIKGENIYQQGLPAKFSKFKRTDYYDPIFANIGMQPIYNKEIYAQGNSNDNLAFGFKEAWAEYRYLEKQVAGEFRSNANKTLDYWHIAREFSQLPTNGEEFIQEGTNNLDRALTVESKEADQFQAAFAMDAIVTRVMPPHSVPGLKRF